MLCHSCSYNFDIFNFTYFYTLGDFIYLCTVSMSARNLQINVLLYGNHLVIATSAQILNLSLSLAFIKPSLSKAMHNIIAMFVLLLIFVPELFVPCYAIMSKMWSQSNHTKHIFLKGLFCYSFQISIFSVPATH